MIKEVPFLHFTIDGKDYYGGSQEWYDETFAKMSGCSAVLASNLYYYYRDQLDVDYETYRKTMDFYFKKNKPGLIGFPYFMKFISNFLEENQELSLKIDYIRCLHSEEEAVDFVKKHINQGLPVGMLILTHNAKEINDETWHWMCVTGYDDVKKEVIISSVGERITMKWDVVFAIAFRNVVKLLSFVDQQEDRSSQVIVRS